MCYQSMHDWYNIKISKYIVLKKYLILDLYVSLYPSCLILR